MNTKIIGINGFKRTGKGETGAAIESVVLDHLGCPIILGFADKLKILAARTLGFLGRSDEECIALMDEAKEKWVFDITADTPTSLILGPMDTQGKYLTAKHRVTGRGYLQHLGTEARKIFGPDFWVDQVLPKPYLDGGTMPRPAGLPHPGNQYAIEKMYGRADHVAFTDLRFENEAERVLALGGEVWEVIRPNTASDGHDSEQVLPRRLVTRQIHNSGTLMDLRYEVEKALAL